MFNGNHGVTRKVLKLHSTFEFIEFDFYRKDPSLEKTIVRIGGADRYATSLEVAKYFKLTGQNICVASGNNFPDALTGSVYAADHNAPIILANDKLSDEVMNYLEDKKMTGATIFGGEAVVSKYIEQQLGQLIGK